MDTRTLDDTALAAERRARLVGHGRERADVQPPLRRLEGMLLKPNMVLPGKDCADQSDPASIAAATVETLLRCMPAAVPGVAFLSGGQTAPLASARPDALNRGYGARLPWALTFSFARAIQQPAMEAWRGAPANVPAAQQALAHRAACNRAAGRGRCHTARDAPAAN